MFILSVNTVTKPKTLSPLKLTIKFTVYNIVVRLING